MTTPFPPIKDTFFGAFATAVARELNEICKAEGSSCEYSTIALSQGPSQPCQAPNLDYSFSKACEPKDFISNPRIDNSKLLSFAKNPDKFDLLYKNHDCKGVDDDNLLHEAAKRQDLGGLAELVLINETALPLLVAQTKAEKFSPLHIAAIKGVVTLVAIFLDPLYLYGETKPENFQSPLHLQTRLGHTALHLSSSNGHKGVVLQLLAADPTLKTVQDKEGLTAADHLKFRLKKGDLSHLNDPLQKQKYQEILGLITPEGGTRPLKEIREAMTRLYTK